MMEFFKRAWEIEIARFNFVLDYWYVGFSLIMIILFASYGIVLYNFIMNNKK